MFPRQQTVVSSSESWSESYPSGSGCQEADICSSNPFGNPFQGGTFSHPVKITKRNKSNESPLCEVKMTTEEDLKGRTIKPGTLLTSTENSEIGTTRKTTGQILQTALSIVMRNLSVLRLSKGGSNSKAPASAFQSKWFTHHRQNTSVLSSGPKCPLNWAWNGHLSLKSEQFRFRKYIVGIKPLVKKDAFKRVYLTLFSTKSGSSWARCCFGHESRGSGFARLILSIWQSTDTDWWWNEWIRTLVIMINSKFAEV